MQNLELNIIQALDFHGPMYVEEIMARLAMRNILVQEQEIKNALDGLVKRRAIRVSDLSLEITNILATDRIVYAKNY